MKLIKITFMSIFDVFKKPREINNKKFNNNKNLNDISYSSVDASSISLALLFENVFHYIFYSFCILKKQDKYIFYCNEAPGVTLYFFVVTDVPFLILKQEPWSTK